MCIYAHQGCEIARIVEIKLITAQPLFRLSKQEKPVSILYNFQ